MKSVARTVCGIELSEDIINLIFAIFDDDDSKDGFHILVVIFVPISLKIGMKTDIRHWVDVSSLMLWRLVSSVVLTVNEALNSPPSFGLLDLVPAKRMPRNLSKMFTTLLQKNSKVNPKPKKRKSKNDFQGQKFTLFIFYCIFLYIHCCLRPFLNKIQ